MRKLTLKIVKVHSRHLPVPGQQNNTISRINVLNVNRSVSLNKPTPLI